MTDQKTSSAAFWKTALKDRIPPDWGKEIDHFETEMLLKKEGKLEDRVFAESRLRRGVYGQRYDNGFRHDGKESRPIPYPQAALTKGPSTLWDAPGMLRIKIPYGKVTPEQMDVFAELAEEYSDAICHVTTRQDIQLHFTHIEDMPSQFRRLAAVGITTQEACGNSVRNVTGCPYAGVCSDESFDTTPYSEALFRFLLGHPDIQDFGRKFKIAFSGCKDHACAVTNFHDLGLIARVKTEAGKKRRGFEFYVGGGLGTVPFQAALFSDFVPEEELLPLTQAVCRVFARYGEKKKRNRARIKFLVSDWGIEKFKAAVLEERAKLPPDPQWAALISDLHAGEERPLHALDARDILPQAQDVAAIAQSPAYRAWRAQNVRLQPQAGYGVATVMLPLGDATSNQMRALADLARRFVGSAVRTTVEQNLAFRWVRERDMPAFYEALTNIDLAGAGASSIVDVTSCPGTDTCKLGVSSSRGLAGKLRVYLGEQNYAADEAVRNLHIKVSGCFNSCGQHHVADIGFYGASRKVGDYMVPHFQLVLGGEWEGNAAAYGLAVVALPSKVIPQAVDRLVSLYRDGHEKGESFRAFVERVGKVAIKKSLDDLVELPSHDIAPDYYVDWGGVREYSKKDIGVGECAGEVVSLVDFGLKAADREVFEAQICFEKKEYAQAVQGAILAMVYAAQGFVKLENVDISADPKTVAREFRSRFCDNQRFHDPFAGDKFANYFFRAVEGDGVPATPDRARKLIEEAQLFIEASHSFNARMGDSPPSS